MFYRQKRAYQNGSFTRWGVRLVCNKKYFRSGRRRLTDSVNIYQIGKLTFTKSVKPLTESVKHKRQYTKDTTVEILPPTGGNGQVKPERRKAERIDYESLPERLQHRSR